MTHDTQLAAMEDALENGGEAGLERYIIDHFEELPKDVQGKALVGFLREAVEGSAEIEQIQNDGIAAIDTITAMKEQVAKNGLG